LHENLILLPKASDYSPVKAPLRVSLPGIKACESGLHNYWQETPNQRAFMISTEVQPELSEAAQIRLILDGNIEGFCELVRPYQRGLYLKALSIVRAEADAEEITQNAVLKAFTKLGQFRHDSQFRTWLTSITINEARMWLRANRRVKHEPFDHEDGEGWQLRMDIVDTRENPFQALERKQVRTAIVKALTMLPSRDSQVFILRDLRLLSIAETARTLGISETSVKSRLRRGRMQMRQALAHLRSTQTSERDNGSNSPSRRLCNSGRLCTWPTNDEDEMERIQ
jgi:RNA polymerase sigma-70 factor, ECF subfamily